MMLPEATICVHVDVTLKVIQSLADILNIRAIVENMDMATGACGVRQIMIDYPNVWIELPMGKICTNTTKVVTVATTNEFLKLLKK
jgi:hypothetical protein